MTPLLLTTAALAEKELELALPKTEFSEEDLLRWLSAHIGDMLEHRPEQLFTVLYLMDVDERKFREVLFPGHPEPADTAIAKLVVERLKKKAETRLQYGGNPNGEWLEG